MFDERSERDAGADDSDETSQSLDRVELPDHASAYYSPVPPPAVTQHQTIETEAVRLDPRLAADAADTQRMPAEPFDTRNAPTVILRAVRRPAQPRRLWPFVVAIVALAAGVGIALIAMDRSPASADSDAQPRTQVDPTAAIALPRPETAREPVIPERAVEPVTPERTAEPVPSASATAEDPANARPRVQAPKSNDRPHTKGRSTAPSVSHPLPVREPSEPIDSEMPGVAPAAPANSAVDSPRPWLKNEAPKAWLK